MVKSAKNGDGFWCIKPFSSDINFDPRPSPVMPWYGQLCNDTMLCSIDVDGRPIQKPTASTYVSLNDLFYNKIDASNHFIDVASEWIAEKESEISYLAEDISIIKDSLSRRS